MRLNGKAVELRLLQQELTDAGVSVPRGLGIDDDDLHTYDDAGAPTDVPAGAGAVVAAHAVPAAPDAPDFGGDLPADFDRQLAAAVATLRQYLGVATPSAGQSAAALKLVIRVLFLLVRRAPR